MGEASPIPDRRPPSLWRRRAIALGLGLLPFLLAEAACILLGVGVPADQADPFVGFSSIVPLFEQDEESGRMIIAERRRKFFAVDSFPIRKGPNDVRIFCLGGSTVQGRPYSIETSFARCLEQALSVAEPHRSWDVINCGGVSYASYRLVPILDEVLEYEPDLIIVCTGHNEFLEAREYPLARAIPQPLHGPLGWLARRRIVGLLSRIGGEASRSAPSVQLPTETDPLLDHQYGLDWYRRDDNWRRDVVTHFTATLDRIAARCEAAGVPLILVLPPSNLSDCPPFKSDASPRLAEPQRERVQQELSAARELYQSNITAALAHLQQAAALDPDNPAIQYELGQCYEILHDLAAARSCLVRARDLDLCPLRIISPLEDAIRKIALAREIPLLDAHQLLESASPGGILGEPQLVDHVHPSFDGHRQIGLALTREVRSLGLLDASLDERWERESLALMRQQFESLGPEYLYRGQRTLEAVRGWTEGRADGPPLPSRDTTGIPPDDTQPPSEAAP